MPDCNRPALHLPPFHIPMPVFHIPALQLPMPVKWRESRANGWSIWKMPLHMSIGQMFIKVMTRSYPVLTPLHELFYQISVKPRVVIIS